LCDPSQARNLTRRRVAETPAAVYHGTMRRLTVVLLFAVGLVASGCVGADGQRAKELLSQAQAAETTVKSAAFELELTATYDGQEVGMTMRGGGYMKGKRAGDMFVEATTSGAFAGFDFAVVAVGDRAHVRMNGDWRRFPRPASLRQETSPDVGSAAFLELARYVRKVKVTEHQIVDGEPAAIISGVVDTAGLVNAMAKLNGVASLAGGSAPDVSEIADKLGDTRATVAISERTHLVRVAIVSLTAEAQGKSIDLQLVYRLSDVNGPVSFPRLS
jgi:hypothetical protein